jgi:NADPH:quinone reductase-like Zn-dependent oxidoreductase
MTHFSLPRSRAPHAGGFPLGAEGAGEVVAAGEGVQLAPGDAVTFVGVRSARGWRNSLA